MKEYKYTINGNIYTVAVGDIDNNVAQVEVNGTPYKVELENKPAAAATVVKAPRPAGCASWRRRSSKSSTTWSYPLRKLQSWRYCIITRHCHRA